MYVHTCPKELKSGAAQSPAGPLLLFFGLQKDTTLLRIITQILGYIEEQRYYQEQVHPNTKIANISSRAQPNINPKRLLLSIEVSTSNLRVLRL
jgi:hypothetical protein